VCDALWQESAGVHAVEIVVFAGEVRDNLEVLMAFDEREPAWALSSFRFAPYAEVVRPIGSVC